jgi:hypothetical protein
MEWWNIGMLEHWNIGMLELLEYWNVGNVGMLEECPPEADQPLAENIGRMMIFADNSVLLTNGFIHWTNEGKKLDMNGFNRFYYSFLI